ncbi:MAG: ribonuclease P protein component [Oscillospiraceae bacterium]|nr:ribonuclease P protein component [Oscillospiraceae bacterium]
MTADNPDNQSKLTHHEKRKPPLAVRYARVKKNREFSYVFKKARSMGTAAFVCYYLESRGRVNRLGIVTSKKVGNAVKRSRARRVIREAFRRYDPLLKSKTDKRFTFVFLCRDKTPAMKSGFIYEQMTKFVTPKLLPK